MDQILTSLYPVLGIFVIGVGVAALIRKLLARSGGKLPYLLVDSLLTPAERSFFGVLQHVADDLDLQVFAKVRLSDLLWIPRGTDNRIRHQNRIRQKHMDFVLCDRHDIVPVLAIELDDSSHRRSDRQERDAFVEQACAVAGLPLLRISTRKGYAPGELAEQIRARLDGMRASNRPGDAAAVTPSIGHDLVSVVAATTDSKSSNGDNAMCPKCGAPLVERQSRRTGDKFLGCPNYPNCRHTQPLADIASRKVDRV